jgi:hypothetical protein
MLSEAKHLNVSQRGIVEIFASLRMTGRAAESVMHPPVRAVRAC